MDANNVWRLNVGTGHQTGADAVSRNTTAVG
jgi:hypothetical protein